MWTLGREREKEYERKFLGSKDSSALEAVVDVVHDLLEGGAVLEQTVAAFRRGFIDGGGGTWESTGSWLRKMVSKQPVLSELWLEFASHRLATKRFRAAAFVDDMPESTAMIVLPRLLSDLSAKVRSKVAGEQYSTEYDWVEPLLLERRSIETNSEVIDSIDFALEGIRDRK